MLLHSKIPKRYWLKTEYEVIESIGFETEQVWKQTTFWDCHRTFSVRCYCIKTGCSENVVLKPAVWRFLDAGWCDLRFERNSPVEARHRFASRFVVLLWAAKCFWNNRMNLSLSYFDHSVRTTQKSMRRCYLSIWAVGTRLKFYFKLELITCKRFKQSFDWLINHAESGRIGQ